MCVGRVLFKSQFPMVTYMVTISVLLFPDGDSDGMFKGKRYMFTPPEHGKFFKIRDVTTMLNIQVSASLVALHSVQ